MKKSVRLLILLCFSAIIMSGCIQNNAPHTRVVTQVDISCQQETFQLHRHYTDPQKMEYVLLYLRLLKPMGKTDPLPDDLKRDLYEITLSMSDGTQRSYRQLAHRYLSKDAGPWRPIDPKQAAGLYFLMQKLPSDPAFARQLSLTTIS